MVKSKQFYTISTSLPHEKQLKLSVVLACFGKASVIEEPLESAINSLTQVKNDIMLIIVLDGEYYLRVPVIKNIERLFPYHIIICMEEQTHLPAKLYNVALDYINTPYVSFAWAGSHFDRVICNFAQNRQNDFKVYAIRNPIHLRLLYSFEPSLVYGFTQTMRLFDLNNFIIAEDVVRFLGEFDPSPLLQKDFDQEWILRLTKYYVPELTGIAESNSILGLEDYPFIKHFNFKKDITDRYLLRLKPVNFKAESKQAVKIEEDFYKDIPHYELEELYGLFVQYGLHTNLSRLKRYRTQLKKKYKITIIGYYWGYHHNQLCFFNYLDKVYGKGFATYKVLLDSLATPEDIEGSDLVIFSICRKPGILDIVEKCRNDGIPTLYMLDDNWLTIAKDLPDAFGQIFVEGNPEYDTFLDTVKKCDAVIVYNKFLQEDIVKYNQNVILFQTNINFDFYLQNSGYIVRQQEQNKFTIGYTGTLRFDDVAFKALANIAHSRKDIRVLLFGIFSPEQLSLFKDTEAVVISDFKPYSVFCKMLKSYSPDILLAPLDNNRTYSSKCPNKYLEIGAVKAAGIYSDVYPYRSVVRDCINGLLVTENTVEAWEEKILMLADNRILLEKIKRNCYRDIKNHYKTEKLLGEFCEIIEAVIEDKKHFTEKAGGI
ncbi:MAG: hypothetical protein Q8920_16640 [Bacillota bacterium]|nr:hypothetical protein [Bacillota bacterium]